MKRFGIRGGPMDAGWFCSGLKRFGLKSPEGSASFGESAKEGKRFPLKSRVKPKRFASQPRERESFLN